MTYLRGGVTASCRVRSAVICGVFVLGFLVIVSRLFYLQVIRAPEGAAQAKNQHFQSVVVEGDRGGIVDRHGNTLAINIEVPSVYARPSRIQRPAYVARELAPLLDVPVATLLHQVTQEKTRVQLKRKLVPERAESVAALQLAGISVEMESHRFYPKGGFSFSPARIRRDEIVRDSRGLSGDSIPTYAARNGPSSSNEMPYGEEFRLWVIKALSRMKATG